MVPVSGSCRVYICTALAIAWLAHCAGIPEISKKQYSEKMSSTNLSRPSISWEGVWSPWSTWSPCSRICGGGVSIQNRECLRGKMKDRSRHRRRSKNDEETKKTSSARSHCVGLYKRVHLCNKQSCPPSSVSFRGEQCAIYNKKPFMGTFYRWEPYTERDVDLPCALHCRPVGFRFYARLNTSVIDGTRCRPGDDSAVCVGGMCQVVGCDGVVGSGQREDACGVCGGDNSTCRLVSGLFTRSPLPVGYTLVSTLPTGACSIHITEIIASNNYLALRLTDGPFIINGDWALSWTGNYDGSGTSFSYVRQDGTVPEVITAKGPLTHSVDLMVLAQNPNPGIKYEYMTPIRDIPHISDSINGKSDADGVKDVRRQSDPPSSLNVPTSVLSSDAHVSRGSIEVVDNKKKNGHRNGRRKGDRKFIWKVSGFSECSRSCGGGTQSTLAICIRSSTQQSAHERKCRSEDKPPAQTARCNMKPCVAEWTSSEWSSCSSPCGEGEQTRDVWCEQRISPALTIRVADGACITSPPELRKRKCHGPPCNQWRTGHWGKCSSDCGKGVRQRDVHCLSPINQSPTSETCPLADKPANEEVCDMGSCSPLTWFVSEWSQQCSEECGTGVQTRRVHCSGSPKSDGTKCDANSRPPASRPCSSDRQCGGKWFTGPWGQCSASCGPGRQTREVLCVAFLQGQFRVALDMTCDSNTRPPKEQTCQTTPCGPEWFTAQWTECSRPCGTGVQRREVKCIDGNHTTSTKCDEGLKSPIRQPCNTHTCTSTNSDEKKDNTEPEDESTDDTENTKDPNCTDKFRNCHLVVQARLCRYKYYRTACCTSCHRRT